MPLVSIGEHKLFYQEVDPTMNGGPPDDPSTALRVTPIGGFEDGPALQDQDLKPGRTSGPPDENLKPGRTSGPHGREGQTGASAAHKNHPQTGFEGATQADEFHDPTLKGGPHDQEVQDKHSPSPIIFLHGFTLDHRQWLKQAAYFGRSRRVISIDAMGHGKSDAPETGYSRADRVEHLRAFVEEIGIDKFHLVGLSMGGTTAIGYALKFAEQLASLTLASTAAAGWKASNKVSMVDRLAREKGLEVARRKWKQITLLYYKHEHQDIKQQMETMVDDFSGAVWLDPMRGKYDREYDLDRVREISVPTTIMVGSLDRIFVPLAHTLHEQIPESRLLVYENVGHMLNMEQPDRFNADLEEFLRQVETVS